MKIIPKDTILTVREMKLKTGIVVKATRVVGDGKTVYTIRYTDDGPDELILMGSRALEQLLKVNPSKSRPVLFKSESIFSVAVAQRADEMYRLIKGGHGMFEGNEVLTDTLRDYGLQKKILVKGTQVANLSETIKVQGSKVVTKHPIVAWHPHLSERQISVRKAGGSLTVVSYDANKGVIELEDEGHPVPDGTSVEVQYRTNSHLIVWVTDKGKPVAAILSKELRDYLAANQ